MLYSVLDFPSDVELSSCKNLELYICRYAEVNVLVEIPMDLERIALIKQRFLTLASCMPMDEFLSGWFFGVPPDQVLRGNVEDFIAYGFYCRRLEDLSPEVFLALE